MFQNLLRNPLSRAAEDDSSSDEERAGPASGPHSLLDLPEFPEYSAGAVASRTVKLKRSVLTVPLPKMVNPQPSQPNQPSYSAALQLPPAAASSALASDASVNQGDTLQQILAALKAVQNTVEKQRDDFNEFRSNEFNDVKTKLERNISALDQRQLALEAAQDRTDKTVAEVQEEVKKRQNGQAVSSKHMGDLHERLKVVELFIQASPNQPTGKADAPEKKQADWKAKDYKDFLSREMDLISGYEQETANYKNVVVVGPKPKREPILPHVVADWLTDEGVPRDAFQVFPRGKNGILAVVFYSVPPNKSGVTVTGPAFASSFREAFPKTYSSVWAVTDQNRILREGKKRARDFADAYKKKYPKTWWRINDNLLIVDEIIVAPVTLIPGKAHWGSLAAKITSARKSQSKKITFDVRLCAQVNLRTFAHCVKIYRAPSFLDDDDASIFAEEVDEEEDLDLGNEDEGDVHMLGAKE
jgi:hypothetical protein